MCGRISSARDSARKGIRGRRCVSLTGAAHRRCLARGKSRRYDARRSELTGGNALAAARRTLSFAPRVTGGPLAERSRDWLRQAEADVRHARNSREMGDYEWAAFASHQAAEKAIKGVFQKLHLEAWGHAIGLLLGHLPEGLRP